jgi:beta-lactam-binding protein with PASTA domain
MASDGLMRLERATAGCGGRGSPGTSLKANQVDAEGLLASKKIPYKSVQVSLPTADTRDGTVVDVQPPEDTALREGEIVTLTIGAAEDGPDAGVALWDVRLVAPCTMRTEPWEGCTGHQSSCAE